MKRTLLNLVFILAIGCYTLNAQNQHSIDSLQKLLSTQKDTVRINTLIEISKAYRFFDSPKGLLYASQALRESKKINYLNGIISGLNGLGVYYFTTNRTAKAIQVYSECLALAKAGGRKDKIADANNNISLAYQFSDNYKKSNEFGLLAIAQYAELKNEEYKAGALQSVGDNYYYLGQYNIALKYQFEASSIREKLTNKSDIALSYRSIATVYTDMGKLKEALEFIDKAIHIYKELNYWDMIADPLVAKGNIFSDWQMYDSALVCYTKALAVFQKLDNIQGISIVYNNLGNMHNNQGKIERAIYYFNKAIQLKRELGDDRGIAIASLNIAACYTNSNKAKEALPYLDEALLLGKKIDSKDIQQDVIQTLAVAHAALGNYKDAYSYEEQYAALKDTLYTKETSKQFAEMETRYNSEKKETENKLLKKESDLQQVKLNRNKLWFSGLAIILVLLTVLSFLVLRNSRARRKANEALQIKNDEISEQKKTIVDSINYSKRIQTSILPGNNFIRQILPESFVLFKPKDIVSGDFYWVEKSKQNPDLIFFAAVDCTGHGVPGALLSMLGFNILNQAVNEHSLSNPSEILNFLREELINTLGKNSGGEVIKDGMDISLCVLNQKNLELKFSGAFNPLYLIREGELIETKANKISIGAGMVLDKNNFTTHSFQLQQGDCIYIFTDGFADQFGGTAGKKFKYASLKKMLLSFHHLPCSEQVKQAETEFENWKGNLEQVDDVLLMGVKIS